MNLFEYLIPFAIALGLLIFFHELGHYLVARWCGVKVLRFSIGFGKPLLKWTAGKDKTEWVLAAFPLGGYVRMLDEREGDVLPADRVRAFNTQSVWRRYAIVAAGPLANFLLAIVVYWALFSIGTEELQPRMALTEPAGTIAAQAGVRDGDLVVAVGDKTLQSWDELRWALLKHALDGRTVDLRVRTAEGVETFRRLDFGNVRIDDGRNDVIEQMGLRPWRPNIPPTVGAIMTGSAAERAGLVIGDRVQSADGQAIESWHSLVTLVRDRPEQPVELQVIRAGASIDIAIIPEAVVEDGQRFGRIGVSVAEVPEIRNLMFATVSYGPIESLARAAGKTWDTSVLTLRMIGRMITGDVSWKNLSGPVTIADYAGQTAKLGWTYYLGFVALISISLGVLNLLPIPVLDGGHLLYYTIEIVKGSPLSDRVMLFGQQVGLVLLVMLMAFAFFNDIARLISG